MNLRQVRALRHAALAAPTYLGCEVLRPRFGPHVVGPLSVTLTVEAGYE